MSLSAKLMLRQGHALVMTPQLLQAIKLLQFSNVELAAFVETEIERNPLLERPEDQSESGEQAAASNEEFNAPEDHFASEEHFSDGDLQASEERPDWASEKLSAEGRDVDIDQGVELDNSFGGELASAPEKNGASDQDPGWTGVAGPSASGSQSSGEPINLEAFAPARLTLREHLSEQLALAIADPVERAIGQAIVDSIDDTGYFVDTVEEIAHRLGAPAYRVAKALALVQTFEPSGIGARNLAECLAIQLKERDRFDPAMQALVANLPLLARRDFAALERICRVDAEDVAGMAAEIRRLDPKPGRAFGSAPVQIVIPDVILRAGSDGAWRLELNPDTLPRILINHSYATQVAGRSGKAEDRTFIAGCLQTANWLTKSLDQRARTILKVSSEIVRQQDAFFTRGVEYLRPLNLRMIADAVRMHESTVSRVTANKFLSSPRGLFELKYFFTASIPAKSGAEAHSAESVRYRIKQLIDQETPQLVLSDDAIVTRLRSANVEIARRTVAKYRESMRIPSSVERRREKLARL